MSVGRRKLQKQEVVLLSKNYCCRGRDWDRCKNKWILWMRVVRIWDFEYAPVYHFILCVLYVFPYLAHRKHLISEWLNDCIFVTTASYFSSGLCSVYLYSPFLQYDTALKASSTLRQNDFLKCMHQCITEYAFSDRRGMCVCMYVHTCRHTIYITYKCVANGAVQSWIW